MQCITKSVKSVISGQDPFIHFSYDLQESYLRVHDGNHLMTASITIRNVKFIRTSTGLILSLNWKPFHPIKISFTNLPTKGSSGSEITVERSVIIKSKHRKLIKASE